MLLTPETLSSRRGRRPIDCFLEESRQVPTLASPLRGPKTGVHLSVHQRRDHRREDLLHACAHLRGRAVALGRRRIVRGAEVALRGGELGSLRRNANVDCALPPGWCTLARRAIELLNTFKHVSRRI